MLSIEKGIWHQVKNYNVRKKILVKDIKITIGNKKCRKHLQLLGIHKNWDKKTLQK